MALVVGEIGKAEERRHRLAERLLHGAEAELDLLARLGGARRAQVGVRPGVDADGVAEAGVLAHHLGVGHRHAPDRRRRWPWCNAPAGPRARAWCRRAAARRRRSAPPRRRRECPAPCIESRSAGPSWCRSRQRATRRAHSGRECRPPARRPVPAHIRACPRPARRPPQGLIMVAFSPPTTCLPRPNRDRCFLHASQTRASRCPGRTNLRANRTSSASVQQLVLRAA